MSDDEIVGNNETSNPITTREYLRFAFLNPLSLVGLGVTITGIVLVVLIGPNGSSVGSSSLPTIGGLLLLGGMLLFALGYTSAQHRIRDRGW
ncbi:hypothetical protein [Halocatena marina]|uniref:hypothetical protein n=1 Tax=Halocatena marina TaxID=2934937 RepID=UPI0022248E7E|nr:hypothetical protein [Halocatena marina]